MRDADEQQLDRVVTLVGDVLGTDAVGAYLFGSAVLGGLITMVLLANKPVLGPPPAEVLDPIPRDDFLHAIVSETDAWPTSSPRSTGSTPPPPDAPAERTRRVRARGSRHAPSPRATPRGSSARRPRPVTPAPSGSRSPLRDRRVPRAPSQAAAHSVRSGSRSPGWCLPATRLGGYRALDEVGADRAQPLGSADLELPVRLAGSAVEPGRVDGQLRQQFGNRKRLRAVRVDQLAVWPKAGRRPAVLLVDAALRRIVSTRRRLQRPRTQVPQQPDEGARPLERRRLVGRAHLA